MNKQKIYKPYLPRKNVKLNCVANPEFRAAKRITDTLSPAPPPTQRLAHGRAQFAIDRSIAQLTSE